MFHSDSLQCQWSQPKGGGHVVVYNLWVRLTIVQGDQKCKRNAKVFLALMHLCPREIDRAQTQPPPGFMAPGLVMPETTPGFEKPQSQRASNMPVLSCGEKAFNAHGDPWISSCYPDERGGAQFLPPMSLKCSWGR